MVRCFASSPPLSPLLQIQLQESRARAPLRPKACARMKPSTPRREGLASPLTPACPTTVPLSLCPSVLVSHLDEAFLKASQVENPSQHLKNIARNAALHPILWLLDLPAQELRHLPLLRATTCPPKTNMLTRIRSRTPAIAPKTNTQFRAPKRIARNT